MDINNTAKLKQNNIKHLIALQAITLYYPVISIVAKIASGYKMLSFNFIFFFGLELFSIAIYSFFWQMVIKHFKLSTAYSYRALVVIYNMFWAYVIFNETITINNIIGSVIILFGIWVVVSDDK